MATEGKPLGWTAPEKASSADAEQLNRALVRDSVGTHEPHEIAKAAARELGHNYWDLLCKHWEPRSGSKVGLADHASKT